MFTEYQTILVYICGTVNDIDMLGFRSWLCGHSSTPGLLVYVGYGTPEPWNFGAMEFLNGGTVELWKQNDGTIFLSAAKWKGLGRLFIFLLGWVDDGHRLSKVGE
ncbi:MAG: hypothetical protein ACQ9MH_22290 [Nitrospinales bacterium]